ncbi:MAG: hypothetical protein L6Q37_01385 [Bdellovibrionaceae bacterium]|nr:hypothetical protein [Pseudobdellovibrionaceae bacterium]
MKFKGPCQLAYIDKELPGHNKEYHANGFSTPLGRIKGLDKNPQDITDSEWATLGFQLGSYTKLDFESGFHLEGIYLGRTVLKNKTYILRFKEASALYQNEILFQPEWGYYDVILGEKITSVFSGPPDRFSYGETTDFQALRVPQPKYTVEQLQIQKLYEEVRFLRDNGQTGDILKKALANMFNSIQNLSKEDWLLTLDMYELAHKRNLNMEIKSKFLEYLKTQSEKFPIHKTSIEDGLQLITNS